MKALDVSDGIRERRIFWLIKHQITQKEIMTWHSLRNMKKICQVNRANLIISQPTRSILHFRQDSFIQFSERVGFIQ